MAQLIKTTGEILEISPKNGINFQLDELQKYVDGYIEIVNLNNGEILVVNEEGKFVEEINEKATDIAHNNQAIFSSDYIAGNVVLCKDQEVQ